MTERESLVLGEITAIEGFATGRLSWIRAYHVRYFRGADTPDEIRSLSLAQIGSVMRGLARHAWVGAAGPTK